MKNESGLFIVLFLSLFVVSCSSDDDQSAVDEINGIYELISYKPRVLVDLLEDGNFTESDLVLNGNFGDSQSDCFINISGAGLGPNLEIGKNEIDYCQPTFFREYETVGDEDILIYFD